MAGQLVADGQGRVAADISRRIDALRILLVAGIVVIHVHAARDHAASLADAHGWPGVVWLFLVDGLFRAGVPTLSLIAGFLLFRRPYPSYARLIRRKAVSLLWPLLVWNALTIAVDAWLGRHDLARLVERGLVPGNGVHALAAFVLNPPNFPTFFLVDLLLCALLSPAIGWLMRRAPLPVLAALAALTAFSHAATLAFRPDILLGFAAGAGVAIHDLDPRLLDRWWQPLGLGFLLLCAMAAGGVLPTPSEPFGLGILRVAALPAAWSCSAALLRLRIGRRCADWGPFAFLLFCAHYPALRLLESAWPAEVLDARLFPILAAPLVILGLLGLATLAERFGPGRAALALVTGSRVRRRIVGGIIHPHDHGLEPPCNSRFPAYYVASSWAVWRASQQPPP